MFYGDSSNPLDRVLKSLRKVCDGGQFALGPDATSSDPTGSALQADHIPVELQKHLDVEYGGLITSPSSEFIGYQFLRVNDATEFIIKLNAHIVKHIKTCSGKGEPAYGITFDTETLKSLDAFLAAKGQRSCADSKRSAPVQRFCQRNSSNIAARTGHSGMDDRRSLAPLASV